MNPAMRLWFRLSIAATPVRPLLSCRDAVRQCSRGMPKIPLCFWVVVPRRIFSFDTGTHQLFLCRCQSGWLFPRQQHQQVVSCAPREENPPSASARETLPLNLFDHHPDVLIKPLGGPSHDLCRSLRSSRMCSSSSRPLYVQAAGWSYIRSLSPLRHCCKADRFIASAFNAPPQSPFSNSVLRRTAWCAAVLSHRVPSPSHPIFDLLSKNVSMSLRTDRATSYKVPYFTPFIR